MKKPEGFFYECEGFVPTEEPDPSETRGHFSVMSQFLRNITGGNTCRDAQCRQYPEPGDGARSDRKCECGAASTDYSLRVQFPILNCRSTKSLL